MLVQLLLAASVILSGLLPSSDPTPAPILTGRTFISETGTTNSIPAETVLNRDGTIRLDSDVSGTIDISRHNLVIDPETGTPRLLPKKASQVEGYWDGRFGSPGVALYVSDMDADADGNVYIAGPILSAGGIPTDKVAMWDGERWDLLGSGTSEGLALAVAVSPEGHLYVGGAFEEIRGVAATGLAKWDGSEWSAVGTGLDNYEVTGDLNGSNEWIGALEFGPDGTLYAGGLFSSIDGVAVNNIAKFDGTTWSAMGEGLGTNGDVQAIAIDANNNVYAGGEFGEFNESGTFYRRIVKWNGSAWSNVMHVTGPVIEIAVKGENEVYVGGDFVHMVPDIEEGSAVVVNRFIYSTTGGASWNYFGSDDDIGFERGGAQANGAEVFDVKVGSDGNIYVVGDFDSVAGIEAWDAAYYDGTTWSALGGGVSVGLDDSWVHALIETEAGFYLGGPFGSVGDLQGIQSMALWTGETWAPLGGGLSYIASLAGVASSIKVGPNGNVYIAGSFISAGGVATGGAAYWDGVRWHAFDAQLTQPIRDIAVAPDGTVYAVGSFPRENFTTFNVARWDGSAWVEVGLITTFANAPLLQIEVDSQGNVYTGGSAIETINGQAITTHNGLGFLAKWDGTEWSLVGGDVDNVVSEIFIDNTDNVYVGGKFDEAGTIAARGIAMWNGTTWTSFGPGFRDDVRAIAIGAGGALYVGGEFEATDFLNPIDPNSGIPAKFVASWNGSTWSQVGEGLDDEVNALYSGGDGRVYAAGKFLFDGSGQVSLNNVAAFDGTSWSSLGGGLNGLGEALAFHPDHGLFVGGQFSIADGTTVEDGVPSAGIALFHPSGSVATEDLPKAESGLHLSNYPNPFAGTTTIEYELDSAANARIEVYDLLGRKVETLVDARQPTGKHSVSWNAKPFATGHYIVRLTVANRSETRIVVSH